MKGTPEDVLKAIPDFDAFLALSDEIAELVYKKLRLEAKLREGESNVFRVANTDQAYFQNGKPASATFIDNAYKFSGLNGELLSMREELSSVISALEGNKNKMEIYKTMIEVWRTMCSNQRSAVS